MPGRLSSMRSRSVRGASEFTSPIDADLYVPGLLEGFLGSEKWMASRLGQVGGRSRSRAKQVAARLNGRLGDRPQKTAKR